MKRVISILLSVAMMLQLAACGSASQPAAKSEAAENSSKASASSVAIKGADKNEKSATVENVTLTVVNAEKKPVVGDRTADNVGQENGEYFANGSDIVKAADYENIVATVKVDSKSDKAITFSEMGWSAVMPDGYKLEDITVEGDISGQIPSNYSGESTVTILAKKSLNVSNLNLNYSFMDYNDEWNAAMSDILQNSLTEDQYKAKYGDKFTPTEMVFNISL